MIRVSRDDRCPVEVYDPSTGDGEPCDRKVTGWAWHDGGQHEPTLMQACHAHETDGAEGIADLLAERDQLAETLRLRSEALDRVVAERDRLAATVAHVEALADRWSRALTDGCPSCGHYAPDGSWTCDHVEGYHHAWSDLRAVLAGGEDA